MIFVWKESALYKIYKSKVFFSLGRLGGTIDVWKQTINLLIEIKGNEMDVLQKDQRDDQFIERIQLKGAHLKGFLFMISIMKLKRMQMPILPNESTGNVIG